jgi:hypothetical protein
VSCTPAPSGGGGVVVDPALPLQAILCGRTVVEYPTFSVTIELEAGAGAG